MSKQVPSQAIFGFQTTLLRTANLERAGLEHGLVYRWYMQPVSLPVVKGLFPQTFNEHLTQHYLREI